MSPLNNLTLVLNTAFEPCNVISVKRAMTLVMGGKAVVEAPSDQIIHTSTATFPAPSVIRLMVYRRIPRMSRSVSRKNILLRDRFTCQYCGVMNIGAKLTLDHVQPSSRGGGNTWTNLVTACKACNHKKADRTPTEAGMRLLHKPAAIGIHAKHRLVMEQNGGKGLEAWDQYLFC
jgi:5-methylcytosine-specific restriction endonuclease McrA